MMSYFQDVGRDAREVLPSGECTQVLGQFLIHGSFLLSLLQRK